LVGQSNERNGWWLSQIQKKKWFFRVKRSEELMKNDIQGDTVTSIIAEMKNERQRIKSYWH
jgi:hypothetical protein